ncbi:Eukaryotic aspartyl protease [Musa troglodytarum]|uniref:Eukaryotic aspartyl protease n=1 Tax=Musa troglodytarum TaxID=320322 RepID=A0A9E7I8X1_9LILI|nr:Eukaryotic aspartyl protease [Musa troglodytarum]
MVHPQHLRVWIKHTMFPWGSGHRCDCKILSAGVSPSEFSSFFPVACNERLIEIEVQKSQAHRHAVFAPALHRRSIPHPEHLLRRRGRLRGGEAPPPRWPPESPASPLPPPPPRPPLFPLLLPHPGSPFFANLLFCSALISVASFAARRASSVEWFIGDEDGRRRHQSEKKEEYNWRTVREGVEVYSNGDSYEGEFHCGWLIFAAKGRFEGDWVDGKCDGHGIDTWAR